MNIANHARTALLAVALCSAAAAQADVLSFSGTASALATGFPDPTCAPLLFRQSVAPGAGSGTSSLGNFAYTSTTCVTAGGPVSGIFAINFANDGFLGTLNGTTSPASTPGVFIPDFTYAILSGTGRFLGASGTFQGTGSIDPRVRPSQLSLNFNGRINAPAVPEPATWSMMLLGFGAAGWSLRRRRGYFALQAA